MPDPIVVLARGWELEIYDAGSWKTVKGLNELSLSPGAREADITTKESGDYDEHLIARRTMEITLKGFKLEAPTGEEDPGQAAVEALAERTGTNSLGQFRLTSPGGKVREFLASARMTDLAGPIDEGQAWGCVLKQSGPVTIS